MPNPSSQSVIRPWMLSLLLLLPMAAVAQAPTITALSPASRAMGSTFTLTGTNLSATTSVRLGEQSARFVVNSATQLTVTVPRGASTHKVQVTTPSGSALSTAAFGVIKSNSTAFVPTGELLPFPELNAYHAAPTVTDLDGDGLLDLLVSDYINNVLRYEQTAPNSRSFTPQPITLPNGGRYSFPPTLATTDLDGDGLVDLFIGNDLTETIEHYEQSAPNSTSFTLINAAFLVSNVTTPILAFTDLDGDGRLDLLVGDYDGNVGHYEQDAANSLAFSLVTNSFNGISVSNAAAPVVTDLEGDGRLDLLVGQLNRSLPYYRQDAVNSAAFTLVTPTFNGLTTPYIGVPTVTDLDGDGLLDLILGNEGGIASYEQVRAVPVLQSLSVNAGPVGTSVTLTGYELADATAVRFSGVDAAFTVVNNTTITTTVPAGVTLSGDVTVTAASGTSNGVRFSLPPLFSALSPASVPLGGTFTISGANLDNTTSVLLGGQPAAFVATSVNQLTVTVPPGASTYKVRVTTPAGTVLSAAAVQVEKVPSTAFVPATPALSGVSGSQLGASACADLDGDGLLDLLVGAYGSDRLQHYEQNAPASASFTLRTSDFSGIRVSAAAAPALTDLDGDGLLDLIVGEQNARLSLYEQDAPHSTSFSLRVQDLVAYPSGGWARFAPAVTDVDGDGLLDLLVSAASGTLSRYEQSAPNSTSFILLDEAAYGTGFSGINLGLDADAAPAVADLDGDGRLDLLVGSNLNNSLYHYRQNAINSPSFTKVTQNILGSLPDDYVLPTITDLDGDGRLDLLVGTGGNSLQRYEQIYRDPVLTRNDPSPAAVASVSYTITFAGTVTGLSPSNFRVTTTGSLTGVSVTSVSGSDATYVVTLSTGTGEGTLRLDLANNTGLLQSLPNLPITGPTYTITHTFTSAALSIQGTGSSDVAAFVDQVELLDAATTTPLSGAVANPSFETHDPLTNGNYSYTPTGASWAFSALAGIAENGFNFMPRTSNGVAVAVVSTVGQISQTLTPSSGSFKVRFKAAQKSCCTTNDQRLNVLVDGVYIGSIQPANNGAYSTFTSDTFTVTAPIGDLTISTAGQTIAAGTYRNVTITGTGEATLSGDIAVTGALTVQNGGALADGCHIITGPGSVTVQAGAMLSICAIAGLNSAPIPSFGPNLVQVTGARTYSDNATYIFDSGSGQITGDQFPATVHELRVRSYQVDLTNQSLAIRHRLVLEPLGSLRPGAAQRGGPNGFIASGSRTLTLLSSAAGTAYVAQAPGREVFCANVHVQRYIPGPTTPSYHHLSSPVQSSTVADITTAGFTSKVNAAYNALPYRAPSAAAFPNVFGYDEQRGGTTAAYQSFTTGYYSPASLTDALVPGRGYSTYISGGKTPDFVGTLTTGNLNVALTHTGTNTASNKAGWHLLGNPYPQPLDWDLLTTPAGLDASVYVWYSLGGTNGAYRVRNASGVGNLSDGLIGIGQGFWVRTTAPATFSFTDALRAEEFATPLGRAAVTDAPRLTLTLAQAAAPADQQDEVTIYAQPGATSGFDGAFDAARPGHNVGVPTLAVLIDGEEGMISALPELAGQAATVELTAVLPAAGTYTLGVGEAAAWGTASVELLDRLSGTRYDLTQQPTISVTATRADEVVSGRFAVLFNLDRVLGAAAETGLSQITLFPNPASGVVRLTGATGESATLLDATGRTVRTWLLTPGAADLSLKGVAPGVYSVRVGAVSRRLVIE